LSVRAGGNFAAGTDGGSIVKNEACGRAVRQQATSLINDPSLGGTSAPAPVHDDTFGFDEARRGRDRTEERNLELERRLGDAFFEHGPDRKAHAAIEQGRGEASMRMMLVKQPSKL